MFHKLLGPHRDALPVEPVERTRVNLDMMRDIRMFAQRDIPLAYKPMIKHAILAVTFDLRHVQLVHSFYILSYNSSAWSLHPTSLVHNLYSFLALVTFLNKEKYRF